MFDVRFAYLASIIYAAAIAGAAIAGSTTALLIVIVVGGPVTGLMYWAAFSKKQDE